MNVLENQPLKDYNTFRVSAAARYFADCSGADDIRQVLQNPAFREVPVLILGGGSNVLFTGDYNGLVIKNSVRGVEVVREDKDHIYLKAGAGENWHGLVQYCIDHDYAGIENLSLIPGNAGAAPIQNIGAYGVELESVFHELEALEIRGGSEAVFKKADCGFAYRDSVFKSKHKGKFFILSVTLKLSRKATLNTSYGAIREELDKMGVSDPTIRDVGNAVCAIRRSKLPDPALIGNAGSFFKNPVVDSDTYRRLKTDFPAIIAFKSAGTTMKLAAGWLIEQCGWKGKRFGDAGVHAGQALVLVNYGKASGAEIADLAEKVKDTVKLKFGVELEGEVNII